MSGSLILRKGLTVYIVGAGPTGQCLVRFCLRAGIEVKISDREDYSEYFSGEKNNSSLEMSFGKHKRAFVDTADIIVVSSGVPRSLKIFSYAKPLMTPIVSAVDFVFAQVGGKKFVVTGSYGKTTFIKTLASVLETKKGCLTGKVFTTDRENHKNYASALEHLDCSHYIFELSVEELNDVKNISPEIVYITNLVDENPHTSNSNFKSYIKAKMGWLARVTKPITIMASPHEVATLEKIVFEGKAIAKNIKIEVLEGSSFNDPSTALHMTLFLNATFPTLGFSTEDIKLALFKVASKSHRTFDLGDYDVISIGKLKGLDTLFWNARMFDKSLYLLLDESYKKKFSKSRFDVLRQDGLGLLFLPKGASLLEFLNQNSELIFSYKGNTSGKITLITYDDCVRYLSSAATVN